MILTYDLDLPRLEGYLRQQSWLPANSRVIGIEKPGEGNMNLVVRVLLDTGSSFILKQAPPYVNRYPSIAAPPERLLAEYAFYAVARRDDALAPHLPAIIGLDRTHHILAFEDLGAGTDLSSIYRDRQALPTTDLNMLVRFLGQLHAPEKAAHQAAYPLNLALRQLNHEHIFVFPFQANAGFDLDTIQPGLSALARPYQQARLQRYLQPLGQRYLSSGSSLLHGDFYPGSWLRTHRGLYIIDPEFSFFGPPEFDLGVLVAHLLLAGAAADVVEQVLRSYPAELPIDRGLLDAFTGVELLRRLIGLAQLPLVLSLDQKAALLARATTLIAYE